MLGNVFEARSVTGNGSTCCTQWISENGHVLDLLDYKVRFYDSSLGRFSQPDTITPGGPQGLNRYSYTNNNPVNATDPTGHNPKCGPDGVFCDDDPSNDNDYAPMGPLPDEPEIDPPVDPDDITDVQWFGGTESAYWWWRNGNGTAYEYCHYYHCGLDLMTEFGTPVYAGAYGTVLYAGCLANNYYGPCKVTIAIPTTSGTYIMVIGHLDGVPLVTKGELVSPDTQIGGVGNQCSGVSMPYDGCPGVYDHIHIEIRGPGELNTVWYNSNAHNPLNFMSPVDAQLIVDIGDASTTYYSTFFDYGYNQGDGSGNIYTSYASAPSYLNPPTISPGSGTSFHIP